MAFLKRSNTRKQDRGDNDGLSGSSDQQRIDHFSYAFTLLSGHHLRSIFFSGGFPGLIFQFRFLFPGAKLVIYFLVLAQLLVAQKPSFRHYDVINGLPSSECYSVMQDSKKSIWVASDAGVTKYDGYSFTTYTHINGLPDNTIFKIHEDRYGKVWFSSLSGQIAYYDYKTDSIYNIAANPSLKQLNITFPIDFCFDSNDTLWVSLQSTGLVRIEPPLYEKTVLYKTGKEIAFIKEWKNSVFIYGKECLTPQPESKYIKHMKSFRATHELPRISDINHLYTIREDDTHFLFSDGSKIIRVKPGGSVPVDLYKLRLENAITSLFKDSKQKVWVSTLSNGLLCFDPSDFLHPIQNVLPKEAVTCVYEDNEHGFWVTTLNNGLYYLPGLQAEYYSTEDGLSSDKLSSIARFKRMIYLTTSDRKLNVLDPSTGQISVKADKEYYHIESDSRFLKINTPYSTLYDGSDNRVLPVKMANSGKPVQIGQFTDFDPEHLVGFTTSFLYLINKEDGTAKELAGVPARILCLHKTDTCILIGTRSGLYMLKDKTITALGKQNGVLSGRIENIIYINKATYIVVKGIGLLEWKGKDRMRIWDTKQGLVSNFIKALYADSSGRLWIGTNRGISLMKWESDGRVIINNFDFAHGLASDDINGILIYKGYLYSATPNGLSKITIASLMEERPKYPVYIEAFYVNGQKKYPSGTLQLRYDQNFIDIHYKSIQAGSSGNILYKYRLKGLDSTWKYTREIQAHFTTLPSGTYTFEVYALNPRYVPCDTPAIVQFSIATPFWKTWWFTGSCLVSLFFVVYAFYRRNMTQLLKREQVKTQYEKLLLGSELKLLRAQMNPHFIFNAINSIQSFILKNQPLEANKYLSKFAKLMRKVLEYSKYESIPLNQDIEILQLYTELEALRSGFCFDVEFQISDQLNPDSIRVPPMIIQPFVENAILHGILNLTERRGKLLIRFSKDRSNRLICIIDDNGVGLKRAAEIGKIRYKNEHSFGIETTINRLEAINFRDANKNEVIIREKTENDISQGTQVTVVIDLN